MPRNVLYIDDDEGLRRLVSRGLEREGIRVVCASDGESGLRALAAEEFDVIALDQNMPGLDGLSTLGAHSCDREPSSGHLRHRRPGQQAGRDRPQGGRVRLCGQGCARRVHSAAESDVPKRGRGDADAPGKRDGGSRSASSARPLRDARRGARGPAARGQPPCRQLAATDRRNAANAKPGQSRAGGEDRAARCRHAA